MTAPRYPAAEIHEQDCHCDGCEPWRAQDARRLTRADVVSLQIIAGIPVALAIAQVAAWIFGVPGPLLMFAAS